MSSSGLIYAIIVGAWAAYLVPMWLRREDELNRARQTQRYSTAIKVLSNRESFERRLPIAVGQTGFPQAAFAGPGAGSGGSAAARTAAVRPGSRAGQKVGQKNGHQGGQQGAAAKKTANRPAPTIRRSVPANAAARKVATARIAQNPAQQGPVKRAVSQSAVAQHVSTQRRRINLINRRRRVVSALFMLTTLGTLITADLGPTFLWTMAVPAVTLSAYIVWLRRDEQIRATAKARRRAAAAAQARLAATAARNAEKRRLDLLRATEADTEELELRRAQSARRRTAAARARADRYVGSADPSLRRAANG
jgi:hypothetical protein